MEILFLIAIIALSVILHEVSHGYVANALGDPTARLAGRLTLNPVPHIDLLGTILLPGILLLTGSPFLFGWAKPVPYNPYNLRALGSQRWSEALVAGAGPLVNIAIAVVFSIILHLQSIIGFGDAFAMVAVIVVLINIVLAVVNLIPIPPIDGSKILHALLPNRFAHVYRTLEGITYRLGPFGLIAVLLLILFVLGPILSQLIFFLVSLFTGLPMHGIAALLQTAL